MADLLTQLYAMGQTLQTLISEHNALVWEAQHQMKPLVTECCEHPIDASERYCPKCGWEARVEVGEAHQMTKDQPKEQVGAVCPRCRGTHYRWLDLVGWAVCDCVSFPKQSDAPSVIPQADPWAEYDEMIADHDYSYASELIAAVRRARLAVEAQNGRGRMPRQTP